MAVGLVTGYWRETGYFPLLLPAVVANKGLYTSLDDSYGESRITDRG